MQCPVQFAYTIHGWAATDGRCWEPMRGGDGWAVLEAYEGGGGRAVLGAYEGRMLEASCAAVCVRARSHCEGGRALRGRLSECTEAVGLLSEQVARCWCAHYWWCDALVTVAHSA